jgi:hypothetical protein
MFQKITMRIEKTALSQGQDHPEKTTLFEGWWLLIEAQAIISEIAN